MFKGLASAAATTLGRHSLVYGSGTVVPFAFGLINIAVLTRFIAPAAFGQLAVLLILAASLSIFYTLATLQGTFRMVFGSDGEAETDDDDVNTVSDKGHALGTGIALTALIGVLGTVALWVSAKPLTQLLFLDESQANLVVLAGIAGAVGALWRLVVNIPRLERKAKTYAVPNSLRPLLTVSLSVGLVAVAGGGIRSVLV